MHVARAAWRRRSKLKRILLLLIGSSLLIFFGFSKHFLHFEPGASDTGEQAQVVQHHRILQQKTWASHADHGDTKPDPSLVVGVPASERVASQLPLLALDALSPRSAVVVQYRGDQSACTNAAPGELERLGVTVFPAIKKHPQVHAQMNLEEDETIEYVMWRATESLDYATLLSKMYELYPNAPYFAVYEDDVRLAHNTSERILELIEKHEATIGDDWSALALYTGANNPTLDLPRVWGQVFRIPYTNPRQFIPGTQALVFRNAIIPRLIKHINAFYAKLPIDFLILQFFPEDLRKNFFEFVPNLAQHMGVQSTLANVKRTTLKSVTFVSAPENQWMRELLSVPSDPYIGCYNEDPQNRDLSGLFDDSGRSGTPYLCAEFCHRYFYFGLQAGGACYCSNDFGRYGQAPESMCRAPCTDRMCTRACGGRQTAAVYRTGLVLQPSMQVSTQQAARTRAKWLSQLCGHSAPFYALSVNWPWIG